MKTVKTEILPTHPSGMPDAKSGWAHLLRLWYKILIEMIGASVPGWERGNGFDLLILEGVSDGPKGLNVRRKALNEWIESLEEVPTFAFFLMWIREQKGSLLDDVTARDEWNKFAGDYQFDAPTIAEIEREYLIDLMGLTHAAAINPLVDAAKFRQMAAERFTPAVANVAVDDGVQYDAGNEIKVPAATEKELEAATAS